MGETIFQNYEIDIKLTNKIYETCEHFYGGCGEDGPSYLTKNGNKEIEYEEISGISYLRFANKSQH